MVDRPWVLASLIDGPQLRTLVVHGQHDVDAGVLRTVLESRRRPGHAFLLATSAGQSGASHPDRWSAILDAASPIRWRLEYGRSIFVNDGATSTFLNESEAFTRPTDGHEDPPSPLGDILQPAALAVGYDLGEPIESEHLGRPCVSVIGALKSSVGPLPIGASPHFGDRCRLIIDRGAHLIVRWQSWFGDDQLADMSLDRVEVDVPISDDAFQLDIPAGVRRRAPQDLPAGRRQPRVRRSPAEALADYMPHGEPPEDPATAEAAIRSAVEELTELSPDGRDAVNVHGGAGLGPAIDQASSRFANDVRFELQAVRFLCDNEAAIYFTISGMQTPIDVEGRTVLVDDRWLIERTTFTRLLQRAGVQPPPAPTS